MRSTSNSLAASTGKFAVLLLVLVSLTRGSSFMFIKLGVEEMSVIALVFLRVSIASFFLFIIIKLNKRPLHVSRQDIIPLILVAILGNIIPFSLIGFAEQELDSGITSISVTLVPVFVLIMAQFFTVDERITAGKLLGMTISCCGIAIIFVPKLSLNAIAPIYVIAAISSAVFYAISTLVAKRITGTKPEVTSAFVLLMAGLMMLPFFLIDVSESPLDMSFSLVGSVVGLAIIATAIPFVLMYKLIAEKGATFFSLNNYLIPVFSLMLGSFLLHETLSVLDILGTVVVLSGIWLCTRPKNWWRRINTPQT